MALACHWVRPLTTLVALVLDLANAKGSIMLVPTHHDWHCQMPLSSPWHMPARTMSQWPKTRTTSEPSGRPCPASVLQLNDRTHE